jgi:hypothetical protein
MRREDMYWAAKRQERPRNGERWIVRGWKEKGKGKRKKEDVPVDVTSVEDLSVDASDDALTAQPFDVDGSPAEVRAHGEVCDAGDPTQAAGEVEEDAVGTLFPGGRDVDAQGGCTHLKKVDG